jgi:hypothetical protein
MCLRGFYNPEENADDQTACRMCPENSNTKAQAATSLEDCLCDEGFMVSRGRHGKRSCICPAGAAFLRVGASQVQHVRYASHVWQVW